MAYNLRPRTIRQELLDDAQESCSEEQDVECHEDETEEVSSRCSNYSDASSADSDIDMEDASLEQRLLDSRARGRPSSTLRGKNGFKWRTRAPERRSG